MIRRRDFITLLGGAAAGWPLAARAQQPDRMRRIGVLFPASDDDPRMRRQAAVFIEELGKLGWIEGRNLRIDLRFAGDFTGSRAYAAELIRLGPDALHVSGGAATRAAREVTQTIPIVFVGPSNAVADVNVARPTTNITGFPFLYPSVAGKWVELLKEVDPRVSRVAAIFNPDPAAPQLITSSYIPSIKEAAAALNIAVTLAPFQTLADIERAVDDFASEPNGGLIAIPGTATDTADNRDLLRRLAARHRLPMMHFNIFYPAEGGLMAYTSASGDLERRAASYVDRILRGAKVSDLPVERPTKFELVINLKTAKALGLTIPPALLGRADEVIE